jgi:hypothetical protein
MYYTIILYTIEIEVWELKVKIMNKYQKTAVKEAKRSGYPHRRVIDEMFKAQGECESCGRSVKAYALDENLHCGQCRK